MSIVKDTLITKMNAFIEKSKTYREAFEESKTQVKQRYYKKKLKKNNTELMDVLIMLDKLNNKETL